MAKSTLWTIILPLAISLPSFLATARADSLFPSEEAFLGGEEWPRRLSTEIRLGFADRQAVVGSVIRFFWGPWAGIDASGERFFATNGSGKNFFNVALPLRISWAEGQFVAPFVAWDYGTWNGGQVVQSFPVGLQIHADLLGVGVWVEGALGVSGANNLARGAVQIDRAFRMARNAFGFLGLRVAERYWQGQSLTDVSLVSGSRF